jgi:hypothetical protein
MFISAVNLLVYFFIKNVLERPRSLVSGLEKLIQDLSSSNHHPKVS